MTVINIIVKLQFLIINGTQATEIYEHDTLYIVYALTLIINSGTHSLTYNNLVSSITNKTRINMKL